LRKKAEEVPRVGSPLGVHVTFPGLSPTGLLQDFSGHIRQQMENTSFQKTLRINPSKHASNSKLSLTYRQKQEYNRLLINQSSAHFDEKPASGVSEEETSIVTKIASRPPEPERLAPETFSDLTSIGFNPDDFVIDRATQFCDTEIKFS
jgi:hypothetical protein